ncbi:HBL055Wp [Eremothecium sinecaudum]|uniref:HBL055Wp n=1 Tax=Eremothecium sinecaudum TaxID=45286 RepID=A0A109UXA6_9SACH|nr:HBL055Wp [Eremothecium sinecaudum]AMD18847.1 HBL055Wp [Eremothecium sinecaudum]
MVIGLFHPQIWIQAVALTVIYIITFITILGFLVFLWTPVFLPISVIFGPAGPLTYILTLYTNTQLITTYIVNSHLFVPLFDHTLSALLHVPMIVSVKKADLTEPKEINAHEVLTVLRLMISASVLIFLVAVPVVGPIILTFAMNMKFAYDNFERYLILNNLSQIKRRDFFYQHLVQFLYYGMSFTILGFVPLLSVWAMACYPLGVSMWGALNSPEFADIEGEIDH